MTRFAGLANGDGRTLLRLDDRRPGGAELAVVVATDEAAPILEKAAERGIPTEVVPAADGSERADHASAVVDAIADYDVEMVCLDGDDALPAAAVGALPLVLDMTPTLDPNTASETPVADTLASGQRVTGVTVHVVADDATDGAIIAQEPVPVYTDDDEATLTDRLRTAGATRAYHRAVREIAENRVSIDEDTGTVEIEDDTGGELPTRRLGSDDKVRTLRYGENPHQDAAVYADATVTEANVIAADQLNPGAKALSYNNYNDADAALDLIKEFDDPAAAVIKHTNPTGCATDESLATAYDRALATDPMSAFGGIVALNRPCDAATAESIVDSYKEVVVAPGYSDGALSVLREKDDLRILAVGGSLEPSERITEKPIVGGRLVQERDLKTLTADDLDVVTERAPTEAEIETMLFAWRTLKHVKSNGILFADGTETVGVGMGQVSRVDAVELAAKKAADHAEGKSAAGAVMASDAFFPFPDGIEAAAEAGIEAVIQPGGSVNDEDVIAAADDLGMAMTFTGTRCFRHD
ncbi:MAG: bifunctional phosphoribosylaminoimidazolecarboxamide formyltransferase/IMP cyclohydrolase [Halobacteriales archaeon]